MCGFTKQPSAASLGCYRLHGAFPRVCPGTNVEPDCTPVPAPCPALLIEDQCTFGLSRCPLLLIDTGQSVVLRNMGLDLKLKPGSRVHDLLLPCHLYACVSSCILVPYWKS